MKSLSTLGSPIRPLLLAAALSAAVAAPVLAQHNSHSGHGGVSGGSGVSHHGSGNQMHGQGWGWGGYHRGWGWGGYGGGWGAYGRGWGWGWGWGLGWGWGGWGPGWWGGYYGQPYAYAAYGSGDWTMVDTDLSPETARVFLDGRFIGMADDFDGSPDYLYLKKGDYRLEFRLDGFETRTIEIHARAGSRIRVDEKLKKIPGSKQYGSYDNPEPEGGVQRFFAKEKDASQPVEIQFGGQPWRGKPGMAPGENGDTASPPAAPEGAPAGPESMPAPAAREGQSPEPGARAHLLFRISPGDAAVYLNDRFVGTGEELSTLSRGLQVPPGQHTITVSRPGFASREETVVVGPGKSEILEITLQKP